MCVSFYFIAFYSCVETESFNTHVLESYVQTGSLKKKKPCMNARTHELMYTHTSADSHSGARMHVRTRTHTQIHTQKPKYVYDEMRHASLNSTEPRRSQRRLSMGPTFGPNLPWQHFHPDQAVPWKIYG